MPSWSRTSSPISWSEIDPLMLSSAWLTPLPHPLLSSPSRSSTASCSPVDAPDGTAARPTNPLSGHDLDLNRRVARESKIMRPLTSKIADITPPVGVCGVSMVENHCKALSVGDTQSTLRRVLASLVVLALAMFSAPASAEVY